MLSLSGDRQAGQELHNLQETTMPTIFDFAKPALMVAGIKPATTWEQTQVETLRQAKAQLARRGIKPVTAARWNYRAWIVGAAADSDSRLDPRVTAFHGR